MNKRIAKLALAAAAIVAPAAGIAATPASAATAVSACFNEATYTWSNSPVQLMGWNGSSWTVLRNGTTNASGCGTFFNTPSDRAVSIRAFKYMDSPYLGSITFSSNISRWATPGSGGVNLGTFGVIHTCTSTPYGRCAGLY